LKSSLRANGSRECAPDDELREAIQFTGRKKAGLLHRFAPRNDGLRSITSGSREYSSDDNLRDASRWMQLLDLEMR